MKFFLLLGGALGFFITFAASLHAANSPGYALRDAAFGCFIGAILFRILRSVVSQSLKGHNAAQLARQEEDRQDRSNPNP